MRRLGFFAAASGCSLLILTLTLLWAPSAGAAGPPTYDISTLAGKVASVNGTAGLQIRFSSFVEQEADENVQTGTSGSGVITPTKVQTSSLDGTTVQAPDVTVNQDTAAATQNETAIAVDPNNSRRVVGAANDYVTRNWSCDIGGTPCSALGDGYSGTYYSNNGGSTWCCAATDPSHLGTLIPGVDHLAGGSYDAGGDPALAFDSKGNVYYAGLGFDRTSSPNTVAVNRGTFSSTGTLSWGAPTFIDQTTTRSIFNDKEWIAADSNARSPFANRVYVTFTRFIFKPTTGAYVQSPIFFAYSTDGGQTFSTPASIVSNVLYDQGSRPVVGPDGTLYVFFEGSTRLATLNSTYVVKSTDGGVTWSAPTAVSTLTDISVPHDTAFRDNSFPAAAVASNGDVYATWTTEVTNGTPASYAGDPSCFNPAACHSVAVYSKSTDGGATWSAPQPDIAPLVGASRAAAGYPVTNPDGTTLSAPAPAGPVDEVFPAVAVSPAGRVYFSTYAADVVSPWQTCAKPDTPTSVGRVDCLQLGSYINNARLDYWVSDVTTGVSKPVTTHPTNTRYQFGGAFLGDYTDLAVGPDGTFHALWTDTNNVQTVTWFYGFQFAPTPIHQQDVATASGTF